MTERHDGHLPDVGEVTVGPMLPRDDDDRESGEVESAALSGATGDASPGPHAVLMKLDRWLAAGLAWPTPGASINVELVRDVAAAMRYQIEENERLLALLKKRNAQQHEVDRLTEEIERSDSIKEQWFRIAADRATEIRRLQTELAEARAAAPEVLWSGPASDLALADGNLLALDWLDRIGDDDRVSVIRDTEASKEGE